MLYVFSSLKQRVCCSLHTLQESVLRWIKPPTISLVLGTLAGLTRGKAGLVAGNALLRLQLLIQRQQVKRPVSRKRTQLLLVLLAQLKRAENCHGEQLAALLGSE